MDEPPARVPVDFRLAHLGSFPLQSGGVLSEARLAYKVFGEIKPGCSAIVYPTSFATQHGDLEWLVGAGKALDPVRCPIVMINLFGSGHQFIRVAPAHCIGFQVKLLGPDGVQPDQHGQRQNVGLAWTRL